MADAGAAGADHFRIYLAAAAGAGKTIAMLDEGERRRALGDDVVIATVEDHDRPVTEAHTAGLEIVPGRVSEYHGGRFEEMDLDGVLCRGPGVALVDELAHTNVPGAARNAKRWQDVLDLLDAGIDVITTVNVQHVESVADAVEQIARVRVRERVPDWVVRRADQIEFIDASPAQLRHRLQQGEILSGRAGFPGSDPLLPRRQPGRAPGTGPAVPWPTNPRRTSPGTWPAPGQGPGAAPPSGCSSASLPRQAPKPWSAAGKS